MRNVSDRRRQDPLLAALRWNGPAGTVAEGTIGRHSIWNARCPPVGWQEIRKCLGLLARPADVLEDGLRHPGFRVHHPDCLERQSCRHDVDHRAVDEEVGVACPVGLGILLEEQGAERPVIAQVGDLGLGAESEKAGVETHGVFLFRDWSRSRAAGSACRVRRGWPTVIVGLFHVGGVEEGGYLNIRKAGLQGGDDPSGRSPRCVELERRRLPVVIEVDILRGPFAAPFYTPPVEEGRVRLGAEFRDLRRGEGPGLEDVALPIAALEPAFDGDGPAVHLEAAVSGRFAR